MIFGRTDLRIGVSRPNFDAESDFEVRLAVVFQKPKKNSEKLRFWFENFIFIFFRFFGVFSASWGPGRLKLGQLTDLDVPDSFFRSDRGQRNEKTSKTSRERPSDGSVVQDYHRQPYARLAQN